MIKHLKSLIAPVLAAMVVAGVAQGAVWQWSRTAATNSTVDPTINLAEGMSPSSVNDSARAMMARLAEYRDDISGSVTTAGTSTAYTITTNQVLASVPTTGQLIAFTPHATNGDAVTLRADGGTVYPIRTSTGVAVSAATLVLGTPYSAKFDGAAWVLMNFYGSPFSVPLGAFIAYSGSTAPNSNFVLPFGQCISRTTYAAYFAIVSTTFGACDGTTTFGVPDLRGRVVAGVDTMGGVGAGRLTGALVGGVSPSFSSAGGLESHTLTIAQMPSHTHVQDAHTHSNDNAGAAIQASLTGTGTTVNAAGVPNGSNVGTTTTTNQFTGGSGAHNIVQPTIVLFYILRVL